MTRSLIAIGGIALTSSCVTQADAGADAVANGYRVSIAVPPPAPRPGEMIAGPSAALLAKAPAPTLDDALVVTPARPFVEQAAASDAQRALNCLTQAVYYEARSEPVDGQRAVAQVVLNRVRNPAYPNSVCGTVYEGSRRATGCQFSFTCDGSLLRPREPAAWARAAQVAAAALSGYVYAPVGTATYYHTTAVNPWWAAKVTRVAAIGAHLFYRLPGSWGGLDAFTQRYAGTEPVLTPGRLIAPKSIDQIVETIEGSVTVHRGSYADAMPTTDGVADTAGAPTPPPAKPTIVAGVRIHRGVPGTMMADSVPITSGGKAQDFGITVHRGATAPGLASNGPGDGAGQIATR